MTDHSGILHSTLAFSPKHRIRRLLRWIAMPTLFALLVNIGVAIALSTSGAPSDGAMTTASESTGDGTWTVTVYEKTGATLVTSTLDYGGSAGSRNWSASQVCGPPNTPTIGDIGTAWASATQDGQVEWLDLTYAQPVVPKLLRVYETYNPGSLMKVVAYPASGRPPIDAWQGTDPTSRTITAVQPTELPLAVDEPIRRVRIYLDSPKFTGWNEIDAAGLVDRQGNVQWASSCRASSVYGQGNYASGSPAPVELLPRHIGFNPSPESPGMEWSAGFGWPFRALWTPVRPLTSVGMSSYYASPYISPSSTVLPLTSTSSGSMSGYPFTSTGTTVLSGTVSGSGTLILSGGPTFSSPALPTKVEIPYRPALAGLAMNTLIYLPPMLILRWLLIVPRRFFREVSRIRRGACLKCGYDLGYDFIPGCPECGWRRDAEAHQPLARHSTVEPE